MRIFLNFPFKKRLLHNFVLFYIENKWHKYVSIFIIVKNVIFFFTYEGRFITLYTYKKLREKINFNVISVKKNILKLLFLKDLF